MDEQLGVGDVRDAATGEVVAQAVSERRKDGRLVLTVVWPR